MTSSPKNASDWRMIRQRPELPSLPHISESATIPLYTEEEALDYWGPLMRYWKQHGFNVKVQVLDFNDLVESQ